MHIQWNYRIIVRYYTQDYYVEITELSKLVFRKTEAKFQKFKKFAEKLKCARLWESYKIHPRISEVRMPMLDYANSVWYRF